MFKASTQGIHVSVLPVYIDERSQPEQSRHFWAYRVIIENATPQPVQLLRRYWKITDAEGRVEEVRGDGVVGKQPEIAPGESFSYTSGCPLNSPSGIMYGSYTFKMQDGSLFEAEIPAFPLDLPGVDPILN